MHSLWPPSFHLVNENCRGKDRARLPVRFTLFLTVRLPGCGVESLFMHTTAQIFLVFTFTGQSKYSRNLQMCEACCRKHPRVLVSYMTIFAIFPNAVDPFIFSASALRLHFLGVPLHGEKRPLTRDSESLAMVVEMPIGAIEDDAAKRLLLLRTKYSRPPMPWRGWGEWGKGRCPTLGALLLTSTSPFLFGRSRGHLPSGWRNLSFCVSPFSSLFAGQYNCYRNHGALFRLQRRMAGAHFSGRRHTDR